MASTIWVLPQRLWGEPLLRILLAAALSTGFAFAEEPTDPSVLQKQGIQHFERCRDAFYRTAATSFVTIPLLPPACASELRQAEQALKASNQVFHSRQNYAAETFGTVKLAKVEGLLQNPDAKSSLLAAALPLARNSGDAAAQAKALTNLAADETSKGDLQAAQLHITEALRLAATEPNKTDLFDALDIAGQVETKGGDLTAAGAYLNRALAMSAQIDDPILLYSTYEDRAEAWSEKGQKCNYDRDFELCNGALELARADYQQALQLARSHGFTLLVGMANSALSTLDTYKQRLKEMSAIYIKLKESPFHITSASQVIYNPHFGAGANPAFAAFARTFMQQVGFNSAIEDPRAPYLEGKALEAEGNKDAALASYLKAVALLEKDRTRLRDERSRSSLLEDKIELYYAAVLELLDHRRTADAFDCMERSRSRAMADLLHSQQPSMGSTMEGDLLAQAAKLNASIAVEQSSLFQWSAQQAPPRDKIARAQAAIEILEAQDRQLQVRIAQNAPRLHELLNAKLASLKDAQALAREGNYDLLSYLSLDSGLIIWHISADAVQVVDVAFSRELVNRSVAALRQSLSRHDAKFDEQAARELFLVAVNPVLKSIKTNHLVILPHEDLNLLPFQVLQNPADGSYLGERFQITYAPSATVLASLDHPPDIAGGRLLAVAVPGMQTSIDEVRAVASLYPGHSKIITDVTLKNDDLKRLARDHNLLHLSMHGDFESVNPMLSFLKLREPAPQDDGHFTAADMFALPLPKNSLVVLSACSTGQVAVTHGNELFGMERALLFAGASTLVLTSWHVDAPSTALWMRTFYREAQTKSPSEAARRALIAVKSKPEYAHPFYWGPFLMTGN